MKSSTVFKSYVLYVDYTVMDNDYLTSLLVKLHNAMWNNVKFSLAEKIFRETNYLVTACLVL